MIFANRRLSICYCVTTHGISACCAGVEDIGRLDLAAEEGCGLHSLLSEKVRGTCEQTPAIEISLESSETKTIGQRKSAER